MQSSVQGTVGLQCAAIDLLSGVAVVQSVYKTYLDVVHVGKNDTVKTFTTAGGDAGGDAQRSAASIFDSGDLGREDIEAKEAAMVVRLGARSQMFPMPPATHLLHAVSRCLVCCLYHACRPHTCFWLESLRAGRTQAVRSN